MPAVFSLSGFGWALFGIFVGFPALAQDSTWGGKPIAGGDSTCHISGKALLCSGNNVYGQGEDVHGLVDPRSISIYHHTCFIDEQEVWCYGRNDLGQSDPPFLLDPKIVAVGGYHTCALGLLGVQCWGWDADGRVDVPDDLGYVVDLKVGGGTSCVRNAEGYVSCWGQFGQIRNEKADLFTVGYDHVCLVSDGRFKCWGSVAAEFAVSESVQDIKSGYKFFCFVAGGRLTCKDHFQSREVFEDLSYDEPFSGPFTVGSRHVCLQRSGQEAECFGRNDSDQLDLNRPIRNPARVLSAENITCVEDSGEMDCWGHFFRKTFLRPGADLPNFEILKFVEGYSRACGVLRGELQCMGSVYAEMEDFPKLSDVTGLHMASDTMCAIVKGEVQCFGHPRYLPKRKIKGAKSIVGGPQYFCVSTEAAVHCWGHVKDPVFQGSVEHLAGGLRHACLYREESGLFCWGSPLPEGILNYPKVTGVLKMTAGSSHTCALTKESVICWGSGDVVIVPDLKNPYDLASGNMHACALDDTGLVCWGNSQYNQAKSKLLPRKD